MDSGRISQVLPTVKCSICGYAVALDQLGEHVCEEAPSTPRMKNNSNYSRAPAQSRGYRDDAPPPRAAPRSNGSRMPNNRSEPARSPIYRQEYSDARPPAAYQKEPSRSAQRQAPRQAEREQYREPPAAANVETDTAGEAGMAGVGRRGFAKKPPAAAAAPPPARNMEPEGDYDTYDDRSYRGMDGGRTGNPYGREEDVDPRSRRDVDSRYRDDVDSRYRDDVDSRYRDDVDPRYREVVDPRYRDDVDPRYREMEADRGREADYGRGRSFEGARPGDDRTGDYGRGRSFEGARPGDDRTGNYGRGRSFEGARPRDGRTVPQNQRRVPQLDINDTMSTSSPGATPVLSPSGYSSNSHSPPFPRSPESNSFHSRSPSPPPMRQPYLDRMRNQVPVPKKDYPIKPRMDQKKSRLSETPLSSDSDYTPSPSPEPFAKRQNYREPPSPTSDSEDGYGGLAYESDSSHQPAKLELPKPSQKALPPSPAQPRRGLEKPKDPFARRDANSSSNKSPIARRGRESSVYSLTTALDRTMDAILNDDDSSASSPRELLSSPEQKERRLPTRSKTANATTSPPMATLSLRSAKTFKSGFKDPTERREAKRPKVCAKCDKHLDDGRWVQAEEDKVLCEKCWKNMYLPKCRRCKLPIEKQAVSSSDGQLKGKYHKECFSCHKCHKPFPDKSFYVYDGKPLCAYHYAQANDSLCAASTCGQPIEGPCAVSHSGDRYHPAHLLCEHAGRPRCNTRLEDYWEVDGRMLCARHAKAALRAAGEEDEEDKWARRGQKRTTRFMNLTGGGSWR